MKRILLLLLVLSPVGLMLYLRLQPEMDAVYNQPLFHFYIVTFTSFAAAVISILLTASLGDNVQPRHLLAASAFGVMGTVFFSHGIATPNALINYFHPAVQWSAWITLLASGIMFAFAGTVEEGDAKTWRQVRTVLRIVTGFVLIYFAIAIFAHNWLDDIGTSAAPWHRVTLFVITLACWGFATVRLGWIWRETRNRVDGALGFVALWLMFATISMHNFENWRLSWWMYHFLMLISFLVTAFVLAQAYEQTRRFQLTRYYLAASLILTAFLALFASYIFANYSFTTLVARTRGEARAATLTLLDTVKQSLDPAASDPILLNEYAKRLEDQPLGDLVSIYLPNGKYFYPSDDYDQTALISDASRPWFTQALSGEAMIDIFSPEEVPSDYAPAQNAYTLIIFAPLYRPDQPAPIGVAETIRPIPELTMSILSARITGLLVASVTMGVLFLALLLVIRRADHILTARTRELQKAYTDLQRAEMLRDDMTNMIVHDLRNPISAISASLDFLEQTNMPPNSDGGKRFTSIAKNASKKMIGLVNDILAVSKFESGELKLTQQEVVVSQVIQRSLDGFRSQSAQEQKQLGFYCPEALRARLDPDLITRVLDNLISNAFKYTDEQSGIIEIFAQTTDGKIYFHVRDNGQGIPDAYKTYIFDKFKQVPNGSERKGTGLGLTFCRMVVETHGGEIKVQDADGGGSEFVFWIPAIPAEKYSYSLTA